jgi:hypothetical protein
VIRNASHEVLFADAPFVTHPDVDNFVCPGQTSTATITGTPPAGVGILWTISGGEIVSGQGTKSIVWKGGAQGSEVTITAKYDYPAACSSSGIALPKPTVWPKPATPAVSLAKSEIKVGESVSFTVTDDFYVEALWVEAVNGSGAEISAGGQCTGNTCPWLYTNKSGAGVKTLTIHYLDRCGTWYTESFTITVQ